jgi:SNF2 family DNA or RNA helicase
MLLNYTNLEELKESIAPWSYRVTKAECLDLPDKIYQSILVQLTSEQKKLYKQLAEEFVIQFKGQEISAPIVITRLMRFQQIVGGFLPVDTSFIDENFEETFDFTTAPIPGGNPKLDALKGVVEDYPGKMIIWSRFRPEIAMIAKFLKQEFAHEPVVEYHGGVPPKNRGPAVDAFEDMESPVRFFVGQPRSGGIGLNLIAASTVVYFSNEFSAETRWQSEDRCHRIGQEKSVVYIDIEMIGTVDETIRKSLKANKNLADYINDDQIGMGEILWGEST